MSEYGFQGMPNLETFKSFAHIEDLNLNSEAVKHHQKHATGYQTIAEYMERDYQVPKSFEDYIYVSQLLQADGMKTAIEAHRRSKPNCMGTLFWQLNDCWPVTSWSAVDYFGRWKAFQYQVKRSFENILISVKDDENNYKIVVVNDDLKSYQGEFTIELLYFSGAKLWKINETVTVLQNSSETLFTIPKDTIPHKQLKNTLLSLSFKTGNKEVKTLFYFVKPKDFVLTKPNIQISVVDEVTIEISSDVLAKNVFLSSDDVFFSDNYLDVLPNEKVKIHLSKPAKNIQVTSLFDTFN